MELALYMIFSLLFLEGISSKKKKSKYRKARDGGRGGELPADLQELNQIVTMIQQNQPQNLKDFLAKIPCATKMLYTHDLFYDDAMDIMGLTFPAMMSMLLLSMYGCPPAQVYAARMKMLLADHGSSRIRDITDVMVTISETAELHDAFLAGYATAPPGEDSWNLEHGFHKKDGLHGTDTRNVCLEIRDRKRAGTGSPPIDVLDAARRMYDEIKKWGNHRQNLDGVMMETETGQLRKVFDEFQKLAHGSIEDTFYNRFYKDHDKEVIYQQLALLVRNKIDYTAVEIHERLVENVELSLPAANTVVVLGTLTKDDLVKVEEAYKKKFHMNLLEPVDQMVSSAPGLQGFIQSFVRLYTAELMKK